MRKISIFDTTLRDGAQTPWVNMTPEKKILIAQKLDDFWVDMIEAWFAISSPWDFEAIQTIWESVKARVFSLARLNFADIDSSYDALKNSNNRWIHTFIWTSPEHREYKLKMSKNQILNQIDEKVRYIRDKFALQSDIIMFSPEDALRTEIDFLMEAIEVAYYAWANVINIPDTVWFSQPAEIWELFKKFSEKFPNIDFSAHMHNDLWNAVANSLIAVKNGWRIVQWTFPPAYWERAWNADLVQVLMNILKRKDIYDFELNPNLDMKKTMELVMFISNMIWKRVPENYPIIWWDGFRHSSGIHQDWTNKNKSTYEIISPDEIWYKIEQSFILTNQSGRAWLKNAIEVYFWVELDDEQLNQAFTIFKEMTSRSDKTLVEMDDVRKILEEVWVCIKRTINIWNYDIVINQEWARANIVINVNWKNDIISGSWNGPVEAVYNAIIKACWMSWINLIDFSISALSSDPSAEAKVAIKIEYEWRIFEEFSVNRDIVKASIHAFVNCVDRIGKNNIIQ